ncbi:MAG TPA: hypothetical protein VJH22_05210 [Candidatus Nanoarchaeia archaeon]|nr:hypothetical protein [Candidatus Nanoarchaeia archaeon]
MKTETGIALIIAVLCLLAVILLAYPPATGAVSYKCREQMVIAGGGQYSAQCMNPVNVQVPTAFLRRQEGDYRRYAIAQREWDYRTQEQS